MSFLKDKGVIAQKKMNFHLTVICMFRDAMERK